MPQAAGAVWPQGDMADAAAVLRKFRTAQMPDPPQPVDWGPPPGAGVAPRVPGGGGPSGQAD
eukprot:8342315-Pyramimonas_sp.AAC.1